MLQTPGGEMIGREAFLAVIDADQVRKCHEREIRSPKETRKPKAEHSSFRSSSASLEHPVIVGEVAFDRSEEPRNFGLRISDLCRSVQRSLRGLLRVLAFDPLDQALKNQAAIGAAQETLAGALG